MPSDLNTSLLAILPLIVLSGWACVLLLVDLFIPKGRKGLTALLAALGLLVTLAFVLLIPSYLPGGATAAFDGMVAVDRFATFQNALLLVSGLAAIALAHDFLKRSVVVPVGSRKSDISTASAIPETGFTLERGEFYILLLFSITGMMLMGMASDLIILFLALELLSIPLYVMAGLAVPRLSSEEASLKYFLLGAFSSGFVVYGTALFYGATASTAFKDILAAATHPVHPALLLIGAALVLVGLGFKVALVPFHMWTPDVYHGAPSPVTAFMAVGAKVAGFAALLRLFVLAFPALSDSLMPVLWGLAALTMILGNLVAIAQTSIKRLLAYSSIAHAGYILMALVPYGNAQVAPQSVASALFYLVAYAFTNFAAWSVVIALERTEDQPDNPAGTGPSLEDFAGLGRKYPALAAVMAVAMLSFTGVPPTLGFFGKLYLFRTVMQGGFVGLALIGVLTSLISAYYYLRVIVIMYMMDGEPIVRQEAWLSLTAFSAALGVVLLSIFSTPLLSWVSQAVLQLF
jgi:NADH-quinone oxidoreductase subunit N